MGEVSLYSSPSLRRIYSVVEILAVASCDACSAVQIVLGEADQRPAKQLISSHREIVGITRE